MLYSLRWPLLGATAVTAFRFIGETGAPVPAALEIAEPLKRFAATDTSSTDKIRIPEGSSWTLQLSVVTDWQLDGSSTSLNGDASDDNVTQLTLLSLITDEGRDSNLSMCLVAFEGLFEKSADGLGRVGKEACGLNDEVCARDLRSQVASRRDCDFELPSSCVAASNRGKWIKHVSSVNTNSTLHLLGTSTTPAKRGSDEAQMAATTAVNRPFLVVAFGYEDESRHLPNPITSTYCMMARHTEDEQAKIQIQGKDNYRRNDKEVENDDSGDNEEIIQVIKTSDDNGKASADTTRVSLLVAAAALILAILLAF